MSVTRRDAESRPMLAPRGATGGMLISTMLDELERRKLKRALICLCAGGGIGIASIIERV